MEEFNKNIEGIRRMMSELRNEKYAIVNPDLLSLDEYMKTLYLKVLCTVVQLGDEPTEMQVLFLKRIVAGIGVEDPAEEYMRRALEISDTDMQEFLTGMKENRAKYYFALDGLILVSIGTENQECYQYLAEIIELLDICRDDLKHVCLVASSILQQQSSFYDEAKELTNERIREVDYTPYVQKFYCGAIMDTGKLVHYSVSEKKYSSSIDFRTSYTENRVIFENLQIKGDEKWTFENCEEVIFKNCDFNGVDGFLIESEGCKKMYFHKCCFDDFHYRVLIEVRTIEIVFEKCEFENCICRYEAAYRYARSDKLGGIIYSDEGGKAQIYIRETSFKNCGGYNPSPVGVTFKALISNGNCIVNDCNFYNCCNYEGSSKRRNQYGSLFCESTVGNSNEVINSSPFS